MKIPSNLITFNYTSGREYIYISNYRYYQGHYYELNSRYFAGKKYSSNAPELIKAGSPEVNSLLTRSSTYVYGVLSKKKISDSGLPPAFLYKDESNTRYFLSKVNTDPILIREVSKETFEKYRNNPFYKSVILNDTGGIDSNELSEAEKIIPGITTFVNTSYVPPSFEDGSEGG